MNKIRTLLLISLFFIMSIHSTVAYSDNGTFFTCYNATDCAASMINTTYTMSKLGADNTSSGDFLGDVNVAANYVFDLNGHTVTGNGTGYGWKRQGSGQKVNITFKNGTISGFSTGAYWHTSTGGINNITFINNTYGIRTYYGNLETFENNIFTNNTYGISLIEGDASRSHTVKNNSFYNQVESDIDISNGINNLIENNIHSNSSMGVYAHAFVNGTRIINETFGECIRTARCISIYNSFNITVNNNYFNNSVGLSAFITNVGYSNFSYNTFIGNSTGGFYFYSPGFNDYNLISYNNFSNFNNSGGHVVLYFGNNSIIRNNIISLDHSNISQGIDLDQVDNITISNNIISTGSLASSGIEISEGTNSSNIINNTISGFDNAIWFYYDGAGHPYPPSWNNTVTNNTLYNNNVGVWLNNTNTVYISGNTIYNNIDRDIHIDATGYNIYVNNQLSDTVRLRNPHNLSIRFDTLSNSFIQTSGSGYLTMNFTTWNVAGEYHKVWTESSTNSSTTTQHTIGDFPANAGIQIKKNNVFYGVLNSNSTGYISFNYVDGYASDIEFDATLIANAYTDNTCKDVAGWGTTGFALISVLVIIIAGAFAIGWMNGSAPKDISTASGFVFLIIFVVVAGLIAVAVMNPIYVLVGC